MAGSGSGHAWPVPVPARAIRFERHPPFCGRASLIQTIRLSTPSKMLSVFKEALHLAKQDDVWVDNVVFRLVIITINDQSP